MDLAKRFEEATPTLRSASPPSNPINSIPLTGPKNFHKIRTCGCVNPTGLRHRSRPSLPTTMLLWCYDRRRFGQHQFQGGLAEYSVQGCLWILKGVSPRHGILNMYVYFPPQSPTPPWGLAGTFQWDGQSVYDQQDLMKRAGHALCFTEFSPARRDHLGFVNRLLQIFCELNICCALVNIFPTYIAGALSVYFTSVHTISLLYITRAVSPS